MAYWEKIPGDNWMVYYKKERNILMDKNTKGGISSLYKGLKGLRGLNYDIPLLSGRLQILHFDVHTEDTLAHIFHQKNSYHLHLMLEGESKFIVNGKKAVNLKQGDVLFLAPGSTHYRPFDFECKCLYMVVHFDIIWDHLLNQESEWEVSAHEESELFGFLKSRQMIKCPVMPEFWDDIRSVNRVLTSRRIGDFAKLSGCFSNMMFTIIQSLYASENDLIAHEMFPPLRPILAISAVTYIQNHCEENLSLETLSKELMYSPRQIQRILDSYLGRNFTNLLTSARINRAKYLLCTTDDSVADICFACGFSKLSNFYKAFKTETGLTPVQYRKQNRKR